MTLNSLKDIKTKVNTLAKKIKADKNLLPTYGYSKDFAHPHIEIDQHGMHYIIVERGQEIGRKTTIYQDKLLYWIFDSITSEMVINFVLKHRSATEDSRRIMFSKKEELMGLINLEWESITKRKHKTILKKHPFDDLGSLRAIYCASLREKGISETKIDQLAYKKYPKK